MTEATMMSVPLTLDRIVERAEGRIGHVEVVSRRPDKSIHRTTYGAVAKRARRLARALVAAGVKKGDRVGTLMWNHAEHLEAYFGIPLAGGVLHTLNLRLHPDEIGYIASDAGDVIVLVDEVLLPLWEKVAPKATGVRQVIVVGASKPPPAGSQRVDYEAFLAAGSDDTPLPAIDENDALGSCYTSGTTGKPKGVVYTHRSTLLHTLVTALPDSLDVSRDDTLLPVVPMFHVNAWGLPYAAAMVGAKLVFPGPHLDPTSLLELMESEKVTIAAGVPTIWLGIRDALEKQPRQLAPGVRMVVGGAAAPEQLIRDFDRLGLRLIHAWGMTETSPVGLVSRVPPELADKPEDFTYRLRARQGVPPPLVEVRVRNEAGDVPGDAKTSGELLVRAPWVAARYADGATPERWTDDGFFRTGDVATVCPHGFVALTDRVADLIKSGGEWIASQQLESALMAHPAVQEVAVIGVPHPKWSERPLAVVVLRQGQQATPEELKAFVADQFAKFWLPDAFVFAESIPRTSTGKMKKTDLRAQYKEWAWA